MGLVRDERGNTNDLKLPSLFALRDIYPGEEITYEYATDVQQNNHHRQLEEELWTWQGSEVPAVSEAVVDLAQLLDQL